MCWAVSCSFPFLNIFPIILVQDDLGFIPPKYFFHDWIDLVFWQDLISFLNLECNQRFLRKYNIADLATSNIFAFSLVGLHFIVLYFQYNNILPLYKDNSLEFHM